MYWNEKIDLIKKKYPHKDFSTPHVDRKEILKKIETKFIGRSKDYYDLNNFNNRFCNWWTEIKETTFVGSESEIQSLLNFAFDKKEQFWIACEFTDGIMIYKSKLEPALHLISIGQSWTDTFHVIQLKYDFIISIRFSNGELCMKSSGNNEFIERIKQTTTKAKQN